MGTLLKPLLEFVAKSAVFLAPLLAPRVLGFRYVSLFGAPPANPQQAELIVRAVIGIVALGLVFLIELFSFYKPREAVQKFGANYFRDIVMTGFKDELASSGAPVRVGSDIRVNVMFATRGLLLLRRFRWFANDGFDPNTGGKHEDANMWLGAWQGVCGKALRDGKLLAVDLRKVPAPELWDGLGLTGFRMFWWQTRRTAGVKAILSVPLFKEASPPPACRWVAVGIVNVDAVSEGGAEWLLENTDDVAQYFRAHGTVLALLG